MDLWNELYQCVIVSPPSCQRRESDEEGVMSAAMLNWVTVTFFMFVYEERFRTSQSRH